MQLIQPRNKTAFVDENNEYSYSQLIIHIGEWRDYLKKSGAGRVLILSENRVEYVCALYGVWLANAEAIPVDALATKDEIEYIISDAKPALIITSQEKKSLIEEALKLTEHTIPIYLLDDALSPTESPLLTVEISNPEKVATIIYTSGTTGSPKGVMLTFTNMMSNIKAVADDVGYFTESDTALMLLPIHHILPLMGTVTSPLYAGSTIAMSPSLKGEDIMKTLATHNVTIMVGVPRLYTVILRGILAKISESSVARFVWFLAGKTQSQTIRKKLFSSVHKKFGGHIRRFIAGGAKLDIEVAKGYQRLGFEILEGYGLSETSPIVSFPRKNSWRLGSVGQPLFEGSVRIKDGEVYVRGEHVMKGYLNKPQETAESFDGEWFKTGDIGHLDDENHLYITGRKKEIIVLSSGKNIQPEELEHKLTLNYPLISEVAVFLDNKEQLHALIVPDKEALTIKDISNVYDYFRWDILDVFNRSVSSYKQIAGFTLLAEPLPRTRMQKLKRFLLPTLIQTKRENKERVDEKASPLCKKIVRFLEKISGEAVSPHDHIEIDVGIDSLDKMELITLIAKESSVTLTEQDIADNPTPHKMVDFVEKQSQKQVPKSSLKQKLHTSTVENMPYSGWPHKVWGPMLILAVRLYFKLSCSVQMRPIKHATIFVSNHQSFLDALFISAFMPKVLFYKTYFFAKEKHFNRAWKRWLGKRINVVILKNSASPLEALKSMSFVLRNGGHVMIFPEGTRTRTGKMGKFKNSFALLSKELGISVTPVVISGAFEAFPIHTRIPKLHAPLSVSFLEEVRPDEYTQQELSDAVKRRLEHSLNGGFQTTHK